MSRTRYCIIKAKTLEQILDTCNRHISNIGKTGANFVNCEDGTETDWFYISMFRETWSDLRDDVEAMLKAENAKKVK